MSFNNKYLLATGDFRGMVTRGRIYRTNGIGRVIYDDGAQGAPYASLEDYENCNQSFKGIFKVIPDELVVYTKRMYNENVKNHFVVMAHADATEDDDGFWSNSFPIDTVIYADGDHVWVETEEQITVFRSSGQIDGDGCLNGFNGLKVKHLSEVLGGGEMSTILSNLTKWCDDCEDSKMLSTYKAVMDMVRNRTIDCGSVII